MVATSSTAAQSTENEKRRKQTMEKVKANHLSRQLQMRLQYARLKVEHGWQQQTLNEVENLYFHNSHLRGSKPFPVPTIVTIQQQYSSFSGPPTSTVQSSLSFKLGPSNLGRISLNLIQTPLEQNVTSPSREEINGSQTAEPTQRSPRRDSLSLDNIDPALRPDISSNISAMVVEAHERLTPPAATISDVIPHTSAEDSNITQREPSLPTNSHSPPQENSESPMDSQSSSSNQYSSSKTSSRPRMPKAPSVPKLAPSLTAKDMYNFGSASTLTYDSFWSSHSGSTTPRPGPSRGPTAGEFTPTFQIPGDFTSGIPDHGRAPNSSLQSLSPSLTPQQ